MPTYQYHCNDCSTDFEIVQKFSDAALTTCDDCGGNLRKVFSAVGVVFKGSGFYATDNRTSGASSASLPAETSSSTTTTSSSSDSTSSSSSASTSNPAA